MVKVGADVGSFKAGMQTVNKDVEEAGTKSTKFGGLMSGAGLMAAGAITGIVGFGIAAVTHAEHAGQAAYQMAEKFGLAKGEASAWLVVASQLGVDSDMLGSGFKFLSKNVETMNLSMHAHVADSRQVIEASAKLKLSQDNYNQTLKAHGPASDKTLSALTSLQLQQDHYNKVISAGTAALGPAAQAFGVLGLSAFDMHGKMKSANELMLESADAFAKMPDGIEKTGLAIKVFGKQGMEMLPVLNLGRKGLEDMMAAGKATGKVMSTEQVDAAHKLFLEHKQMDAAVGGLTNKFGAFLMPVIIAIIPAVLSFADRVGQLGKHMDIILPIVGGVIGALVLFEAVMAGMAIAGFIANIVAMGAAFLVTAGEEGILNAVMALNPIGLVVIAVALLIAGLLLLVTHFKQVIQWAQGVWDKFSAFHGIIMVALGPVGLFIAALVLVISHFHQIVSAIQGVINWVGTLASAIANSGVGKAIGGVIGVAHTLHLPGFAAGTNYVPRTMLALVHQGEQIIPAGQAGRGGGKSVYVNLTLNGAGAVDDPEGVRRMLQRMAVIGLAA